MSPRAKLSPSENRWAAWLAKAQNLATIHGPVLLAAIVVFWFTIPYTQADSPGYASEIVQHNDTPLLSQGNILWEFGHLVWRPLGWALMQLANPLENGATPWDATLFVLHALILVNLAAALITVVLWHALALRASGSRPIAFIVALGLALTHSFLLYAQTGNSYIPGLCFATLGLWFMVEAMERPSPGTVLPLAAGGALGIAALLWFPYVFSIPGVLAAAIFWQARADRPALVSTRDRLTAAALSVCSFALVLAVVYLATGWARGFRSPSQFAGWIAESSHGWSQSLNLVRMATGLPRSFINLDLDGVWWKRFLFKDPYAPVSLTVLIFRAGLWKLATFYLLAAAIVWNGFRSPASRRSLAILAVAAAPLFLFAVFMFEPGSPERYFPAFPFLALAMASGIAVYRSSRLAATTIVVALGLTAATNLYFMSPWRVNLGVHQTTQRLAPFKGDTQGGNAVFTLGSKDPACNFRRDYPFHEFNSDGGVPIIDLVEIANQRVDTWKEEFAHKTLRAWDSGRTVWVTQRVWSRQPLPEWYWAEGDDPRISWADLPAFFEPLESSGQTEGDDGFRRIEPNAANRRLLAGALAESDGQATH